MFVRFAFFIILFSLHGVFEVIRRRRKLEGGPARSFIPVPAKITVRREPERLGDKVQ